MNTNIKNNEPLFQKKQNKEKSLNLKQKLYLNVIKNIKKKKRKTFTKDLTNIQKRHRNITKG